MDAALLLVRITIGTILLCHGLQKSLGTLQGPGMTKSIRFFESIGHRPGRINVILAVSGEVSSGTLFVSGALTPLAGAIAVGTMLTASLSVTAAQNRFWNAAGGGEYPFVLALMAIAVTQAGPGRWSLDAVLGFSDWGETVRLTAISLGVLSSVVPTVLAIRRQRVRI